jgi:hypothetical protein
MPLTTLRQKRSEIAAAIKPYERQPRCARLANRVNSLKLASMFKDLSKPITAGFF